MAKLYTDFRFIEIEYELSSLSRYRERLEEQLSSIEDQEYLRLKAQVLSAESMDAADRQFATEEVEDLVEAVLPRIFRGSYLVSLWAVFESGIVEIADYLSGAKKLPLRLRDVRGSNLFDQWDKFYSHVANYPLDLKDGLRESMCELHVVRNAYAHSNGRIDRMNEKMGRIVQQMCAKECGLSQYSGVLLASREYAENMTQHVEKALSGLVRRIRKDFSLQ